jgi:hypothetical protein
MGASGLGTRYSRVMRWLGGICVVLVLGAGSACKKAGDKGGEADKDEKVQLVDDAERAEVIARVLKQASDNAARSCPRPVLREPALEGTADSDVIELIYCSSTKDCLAGVDEKRDAIEQAIRLPGADDGGLRTAVPLRPGKWLTQDLADLADKCMHLPSKLSAAVSHTDACSPFLPGRKGDLNYLPTLHLAWATAVYSRTVAGRKPGRAADIMLDYLRLSQDTARGGTSLIAGMIGFAALRIVLPDLLLTLASPKLTVDQLSSIKKQLVVLAASELSVTELFAGEGAYFGLFMLLPSLHEPGWIPPGGFPFDMGPREEGDVAAQGFGLGSSAEDPDLEKQGMILGLLGMEQGLARAEQACPVDATAKDCLAGLDSMSTELAEQAKKAGNPDTILVDALKEGGPREAIRKRVLAVLTSVSVPSYNKYAARHLWRRAALQALQILVDARLSGCGPVTPSDDVKLGDTLRVSSAGKKLIVEVPPWLDVDRQSEEDAAPKPAVWRRVVDIACLPAAK